MGFNASYRCFKMAFFIEMPFAFMALNWAILSALCSLQDMGPRESLSESIWLTWLSALQPAISFL